MGHGQVAERVEAEALILDALTKGTVAVDPGDGARWAHRTQKPSVNPMGDATRSAVPQITHTSPSAIDDDVEFGFGADDVDDDTYATDDDDAGATATAAVDVAATATTKTQWKAWLDEGSHTPTKPGSDLTQKIPSHEELAVLQNEGLGANFISGQVLSAQPVGKLNGLSCCFRG